jgi:hypothetical protein
VEEIGIILARVFISTTCFLFCFVDFLIDKVSLLFNDIRGGYGLIFSNV